MAQAIPGPSRILPLILAVSVGSAVAHLCTSAMPLQIGSLIDGYGLSASASGLVGFFQVGALAATMILFAPLAHRFRPMYVCFAGIALAIVSNLMFFGAFASLPLLCFVGVVGGAGYGLILSASVAAAAAAAQPDRVYAAANSGALLLLVGLLALLPLANVYYGRRGIFLGIAALLIVCVPLLIGFRATRARAASGGMTRADLVVGMPLLIVWSLFSFGTGAMWTFTERIGNAIGLSGTEIGVILSTSVFLGLVGTGLAALVSGRIDRTTALAIGLVGGGGSCLLLASAHSNGVYAVAVGLYWIFTMYLYVLLLGTAATLDPTGRLGTLGTGCERMAFAISAPIGGLFVDFGSFLWIGFVAAGVCAVLAPLCLPALARALRPGSWPQALQAK